MYAKILEILEETGKKKKNKQKTQNVKSQVRREIHVYPFFDVKVHVLFFQFLRWPRYMYFEHA